MFRFVAFAVTLTLFTCRVATAADPVATVVVASDRFAALLLPQLPANTKLVVLIQDEREPDEIIHARALAMRHATHFVYFGGQESPLSALYRERLVTQGAVAVDLRPHISRRAPLRKLIASDSLTTFLSSLSINR
jgi:hypothetical protein